MSQPGAARRADRILVAGALANKPANGGAAWTRLSWILGLRRLGCRVFFVEQIQSGDCVAADGQPATFESSQNLAFFEKTIREFGLADSAALVCLDADRIAGPPLEALQAEAEKADLLVNISGHLKIRQLWQPIRRRVYLDLDPGFTQLWAAQGVSGLGLENHHLHFTVGENMGRPECCVPDAGFAWRKTRQPVLLDQWPASPGDPQAPFTTVASWRGPYGPIVSQGRTYGLKVHEFRKFTDLPRQAPGPFELALDIHPADEKDRLALLDAGWKVQDAREAAADPAAFRRYVQRSGAEFSVAQPVYVETRSGWFSDRTVRYLASARPALVQDTGFAGNYPCGRGLLAFRTLEEAVQGVRRIRDDYELHSRSARLLAERFFDSDKVLSEFLQEIDRCLD